MSNQLFDDLSKKPPTSEQCAQGAKIGESDSSVAYASWYPQMGGYVGRCVVIIEKGDLAACFTAMVWHDGDFPFDDDRLPAILHHCGADQFVEFGKFVTRKQTEHA